MRNTSISLCFTARDLYAAISICDPDTPLPVPLEIVSVIEDGKTLKLTIVESDYRPSPAVAAMMMPPVSGKASNTVIDGATPHIQGVGGDDAKRGG